GSRSAMPRDAQADWRCARLWRGRKIRPALRHRASRAPPAAIRQTLRPTPARGAIVTPAKALTRHSRQEPVFPARQRNHALIGRAEDTKAISRDKIIDAIRDHAGQQPQRRRKGERKVETFSHSDRALRFDVSASILEQDVGFEMHRVESIMDVKRMSERRLR